MEACIIDKHGGEKREREVDALTTQTKRRGEERRGKGKRGEERSEQKSREEKRRGEEKRKERREERASHACARD